MDDSFNNDEAVRLANNPQGRDADIDIDSSASWDSDSAMGSDAGTTGSASVTSSIVDYKYENGRRYHAYREGTYLLPNDAAEQDRLDLHHHVHLLILGGLLYRAPIKLDAPKVLDLGTGTGIWAMTFADQNPSAEVIGNDLSPIQPTWVPQNCRFYVEDVESDWVESSQITNPFDYIHGRSMCGSISDFDALYRKCYENLAPGGWIESQEYEAWIWQIDDMQECKGIPNITKWLGYIDEASTKIGKRINQAAIQKQKLIDAGFINVQDDVYPVPVGTWPKDKKMKELGLFQREHMIMCVEAFTLALFTRVLGWSREECDIIMALVTSEFRNPRNHLISYFHFCYGQKPPAHN